jgi:hypothetical protein
MLRVILWEIIKTYMLEIGNFLSSFVIKDERRQSAIYKKKRRYVKNAWMGVLVFNLLFSFQPFFIVTLFVSSFAMTFMAFAFLDETEDQE